MEIRIRSTGQVMFESEFRSYIKANDGPTWETTTTEVLDALGADAVLQGPPATGGTIYQYSMRQGVEQGEDGQWYTKYVLGPVFADYTDPDGTVHTAAAQEAEYQARKDAEFKAANTARAKELLEESDWADLASVRNTSNTPHLVNGSDFDTYRLALRAIVVDPPVTVSEWPTRPTASWA
jgi:hypothetical protein